MCIDLPGRARRATRSLPVLFTAAMVVLVGVLAGMPFSPLSWAQLIAALEFDA